MRMSRHEYGMSFARLAARRSTCDRLKVGCAIFDAEGHVLSTGYNGSAPGKPHCDEVGHLLMGASGGCRRTIHAEQNAIGHAARVGVSLLGSTAYVTHHPCVDCAKLLSAAGVATVIFDKGYRLLEDATAATVSSCKFVRYRSVR